MRFLRLLVHASLAASVLANSLQQLDSCTSTRPGGGTTNAYRTLRFPSHLAPAQPSPEDFTAAEQLCCAYTRVSFAGSATSPTLVTYDLNTVSLPAGSFASAAQSAMSSICGMSMGSQDCASGSDCMDDATARHGTVGLQRSAGARAPAGAALLLAVHATLFLWA
jgi:hypothetical protein